MAIKLNEAIVIQEVMESIPFKDGKISREILLF